MTYKETLDYLYQQLPMFTRVGSSAFKKDLTNTLALCAELGNPQEQFLTIHIGGTNGKGSTAHALAAILQAMGLRVGLYVSPHYRDFRERIKINGDYISKVFVQKFVAENRAHFERIQPSFFEMTVAMAFDYFYTEGVDIAVIEVGLGGRLDSTNIISPLVSVITNISYDHTDMLGETLPLIAFEKAGIIKPHTPVVIGEEHPETTPVFLERARVENAPIVFASQNMVLTKSSAERSSSADEGSAAAADQTDLSLDCFYKNELRYQNLRVNLSGDYQIRNVATVLQTVEELKEMPFFAYYTEGGAHWEKAVLKGLGNVKSLTNFIGRWQTIGEKPTILCDSAHNEAGIRLAMAQLKALTLNSLHIVIGFVKDKDIAKILALLPTEAIYYFCKADIPRGLDAVLLKEQAYQIGLYGEAYPSVKRALVAAKRRAAAADDLIYVGGSIFVLAEIL